jgi:hypothetical protein
MSRPCIPKNTADALRQQVYAARNRAEANALESSEPIQARWRRLEANDMEDYAENFLALPNEEIEVGAVGEMVPTGERAMERPDLIDTVRSKPDVVTARASLARLDLVAQTGALNLAVDTADAIKARNSLEKMLAHEIAAAHALAMKFVAKSEQMLGLSHPGKSPGAPRGERNGNYRHGLRTIEVAAQRRQAAAVRRELRRILGALA